MIDVKNRPATNMHKCNMWKTETDNQILPLMEGEQKNILFRGYKILLGSDCEVENIRFLKG